MSGGISFSNERYWGKAGWAYREVLVWICAALQGIEADLGLYTELMDENGSAQLIEFIDAETWSPEKEKLFCDAILRGYIAFKKAGMNPGLQSAFEELVSLSRGK